MNILIVNTAYSGGGAETVVRQMINGMKSTNLQTYGVVNYSKIPVPDNVTVLYNTTVMKIYNRIVTFNHNNKTMHIPYTIKMIKQIVKEKHIDVVHLHNIHGNYFGIQDVKTLTDICPVVWTLHDMWTLTGNCFFAEECNKYQNHCKECHKNLSVADKRFFQTKEKAFTGQNIVFVTPSEWLYRITKKSWLQNEDIRVINNGVNIENYVAYNKKELRQQYGLDSNKHYLVSVAANILETRKGFSILFDALKKIRNPADYCLLLVGDVSEKAQKLLPTNLDIKIMGYIRDLNELNHIYSLADVFVLPSLEDNFPCVTLEALAAGTPVVGFKTGGIPEQVDVETGWIAEEQNADALSKTLEIAFSDKTKLAQMSLNARIRAETLYAEKLMLERYKKIYVEVVNKYGKKE